MVRTHVDLSVSRDSFVCGHVERSRSGNIGEAQGDTNRWTGTKSLLVVGKIIISFVGPRMIRLQVGVVPQHQPWYSQTGTTTVDIGYTTFKIICLNLTINYI